MTYQTDCTLPDSLLEQIAEQGSNSKYDSVGFEFKLNEHKSE